MENTTENIKESEYLIIPNPIYDVVFKYLMDDPESAIIVLSTLINEKIKKLHLEPLTHPEKKEMQEIYAAIPDPKTKDDIKLFHLDFTATIELPDGSEELIMIELQKASEPDDIFRFKRYISKNFQRKLKKEIVDPETQAIEIVDRPIKLIPVFILNFRIENEINDLLIRTDRIKTGVFKNRSFQKHNEFIDNLSYNILVVQLPNLHNIQEDEYKNDEYKTKLYALLKLFDQKSRVKDNDHRLRLIRKFFPGFLDRVIVRLRSAAIENPLLEEQMYAEDEYLKALIKRDNKISFFEQKLVETEKELDSTKEQLDTTKEQLDHEIKLRENKNKALHEKNKALEEKDKALEEKDKALEEKDKALEKKDRMIEELRKKSGL
ncbi:MAG: hypothetical protein HY738_14830 [Bacteroidia bacterium]|nr:hypothetical protein [Bacteroidia bacterium]